MTTDPVNLKTVAFIAGLLTVQVGIVWAIEAWFNKQKSRPDAAPGLLRINSTNER
jgi:hypothetical protein